MPGNRKQGEAGKNESFAHGWFLSDSVFVSGKLFVLLEKALAVVSRQIPPLSRRPMLRHVAEPFDAAGFGARVGRELHGNTAAVRLKPGHRAAGHRAARCPRFSVRTFISKLRLIPTFPVVQ